MISATIGANKSLVQGAGGNISIKSGDIIWVKASGAWLEDAINKNIYVPLNISDIKNDLENGKFEKLSNNAIEYIIDKFKPTNLRPSIETLLHVLMPQNVVIHAHSINSTILSCLEEVEIKTYSQNIIFVDYFKPGIDLARAVQTKINKNAKSQIIILKNHGILIGAPSLQIGYDLLLEFEEQNDFKNRFKENDDIPIINIMGIQNYIPIKCTKDISNDNYICETLCQKILTPDQAVFLENTIDFVAKEKLQMSDLIIAPDKDAIIFENIGIFANKNLGKGAFEILNSFIEIAKRIPKNTKINSLSNLQIYELQNWDAEKYRQSLSV